MGLYVAAGAAFAGLSGSDRGALSLLTSASGGWREVIAGGVVVAAAGKSAQLPFSFWLSRAMDGPSPVSALLHSATMAAAGGYLLLRTAPLLHVTGWAAAVAWLGAVTAVVMGVTALLQRDFKQLLAASTCAQVGFMVLAAGSGSVGGGTIDLVAHAATKALLFCVAGVWLSALGTKSLPALRGVARSWPVVGVAAGIGLLGLAGAPPFALWAAKDSALGSVARENPALYVVALLGAALSAAYSGKALVLLWGPLPAAPEAGYDTEQPGTRRVDGPMTAPLVVLAAAAVVLVVLALPPLNGRVVVGLGGGPGASGSTLLLSAGLSLMVLIGTALLVRRRLPVRSAPAWARTAANWWGLERAALLVVARPTMAMARAAAWCEDRVLDAAVTAAARAVMTCARAAGRWGETGIDGAVRAVGGGIARAGRWARRPQTGQLHQYYAQALVALGAVVVVLLVVR